jgi:AcrR family transcriptional regulator
MELIAADAGVTGGALYNHFQSKEELFLHTAEHFVQINLEAIEQAIRQGESWRQMVSAICLLFQNNPTGWFGYPLLTVAIQLKMLHNRDKFRNIVALRRAYVTNFEFIIVRAIEDGDLPEDMPVTIAAELLLAFIFNGIGAVMGHRRTPAELEMIVQAATSLLGASVPKAQLS